MGRVHAKKAAPLLVVMPTYPPAHSGGGLRIHRQYLRMQHQLNVSVHVLSSAGRGLSAGPSSQDGIPVFRLAARNPVWVVFRMGLFLMKNRPAVVHSAGDTLFNYAAGIWAWLLRIRLIKERTMNSAFCQRPARKILFQFIHRYAVLCIALNRSIADQFLEAGARANRIFCRPNPVDCAVFKRSSVQQKASLRRKINVDPEVCLHLIIGRFCSRKNQRAAVRGLSRLPPEHHLLMAGPVLDRADEHYVEALHDEIRDCGMTARVHLLTERVDAVNELYGASDSLWIPSVAEGTPNVMLEALCSGVPVLANRALGLQEFIEDGMNGWNVDFPGDESLLCAVQQLGELDPELISRTAGSQYSADYIDRLYTDRLRALGLVGEDGEQS